MEIYMKYVNIFFPYLLIVGGGGIIDGMQGVGTGLIVSGLLLLLGRVCRYLDGSL